MNLPAIIQCRFIDSLIDNKAAEREALAHLAKEYIDYRYRQCYI